MLHQFHSDNFDHRNHNLTKKSRFTASIAKWHIKNISVHIKMLLENIYKALKTACYAEE